VIEQVPNSDPIAGRQETGQEPLDWMLELQRIRCDELEHEGGDEYFRDAVDAEAVAWAKGDSTVAHREAAGSTPDAVEFMHNRQRSWR